VQAQAPPLQITSHRILQSSFSCQA